MRAYSASPARFGQPGGTPRWDMSGIAGPSTVVGTWRDRTRRPRAHARGSPARRRRLRRGVRRGPPRVDARLDDGRVEELVSGRERGAGIRVVRGETTGFAHTADLSEPGLGEAADAAAAAARGRRATRRVVALERPDRTPPHAVSVLPESVAKARKVALLQRADAAARAAVGLDPPGQCGVRRRPPPHPRRQLRRAARRGRPGPDPLHGPVRRRRRHRHADRHGGARAARSASSSSTSSSPRTSRASPPTGRSRCCGPVPRRRASCRWC